MRRFGLIGGTSWHSTVSYYSGLNQRFNDRFHNNTNPPLVIYNMNQALVHQHQEENNWERIAELNIEAAKSLVSSGVEGVALCANTPHKVYDALQASINVPVLHIADATADAILARGLEHPLLIGTRFTMSESFIADRLSQKGLQVEVPDTAQQSDLHRIIFDELVYGRMDQDSQRYVVSLFNEFSANTGVDNLILGCTEFGLLMKGVQVEGVKIDSVTAHIEAISKFILKDA